MKRKKTKMEQNTKYKKKIITEHNKIENPENRVIVFDFGLLSRLFGHLIININCEIIQSSLFRLQMFTMLAGSETNRNCNAFPNDNVPHSHTFTKTLTYLHLILGFSDLL